MAKNYDHKAIEQKWQARWEEAKLYATPDTASGKKNFYTLVEFPYPSGDLHVGHWYAFAVPDIFARMKRMQGCNSLYPIGFDAFGLPAENAAIKNNVDPAEWTWGNIERMRRQLRLMGNMFDWNREVVACDPAYYRWTQWLFLTLFEKGLAYRGKALVNWDPVDQTVLANEQVLPDGTAERSGAKVEKKELEQWFFKITDYADRLVDDLDALAWPQPIKEAQKNWIGRSEGLIFSSPVKDTNLTIETFSAHFEAFYADTFVVIAPDHPRLPELVAGLPESEKILAAAKDMAARRGTGREEIKEYEGIFTGRYTLDPIGNGELPIWIANYALADYGTGIVKCSAHDERDFAFAKKYGIRLKPTLFPSDASERARVEALEYCFSDMKNGILSEPSVFAGKIAGEHRSAIADYAVAQGFARKTKAYRQRDWLISRQRYWGVPIPIVYDPEGKPHAIPEKHLPWLLPTDVEYLPKGTSPLGSSRELKERVERIFGAGWRPEIDTMDTFVDSSWYFLRYLDAHNTESFASLEKQKAWMPVNRYSGGSEHTTMHVLYSRFLYKALFDMGLVTESEPYSVRMNRGLILAEDGKKMSKRWGNVVNPDEQVANVGADAVKTYLAFIGPYNEVGSFPWSTNGLVGVRRFLERAAGLVESVQDAKVSPELEILVNQSIKKVQDDIESMKFNTSVSQLMILVNEFSRMDAVPRSAYETFVRLLAPFAPHLCEEIWESLGHATSVHLEPWPVYDAEKLLGERLTIVVQVNGKSRGSFEAARGTLEGELREAALALPAVAKALQGMKIQKAVVVPDRLINLVITPS